MSGVHNIEAAGSDDLVHPMSYFVLLALHYAPAIFLFLVPSNLPHIRRITLEALILTRVVAVSLTVYTFWAVKRGHDFSFFEHFFFRFLMMLLFVVPHILVRFDIGKLWIMIYCCFSSMIVSSCIIHLTSNWIKCHGSYECLWASFLLLLQIICLFISLFSALIAADS